MHSRRASPVKKQRAQHTFDQSKLKLVEAPKSRISSAGYQSCMVDQESTLDLEELTKVETSSELWHADIICGLG